MSVLLTGHLKIKPEKVSKKQILNPDVQVPPSAPFISRLALSMCFSNVLLCRLIIDRLTPRVSLDHGRSALYNCPPEFRGLNNSVTTTEVINLVFVFWSMSLVLSVFQLAVL